MDVAIKTSNIIASLVTAVSNADLVFFNSYNEIPSFIPKDVKGVRIMCFQSGFADFLYHMSSEIFIFGYLLFFRLKTHFKYFEYKEMRNYDYQAWLVINLVNVWTVV